MLFCCSALAATTVGLQGTYRVDAVCATSVQCASTSVATLTTTAYCVSYEQTIVLQKGTLFQPFLRCRDDAIQYGTRSTVQSTGSTRTDC